LGEGLGEGAEHGRLVLEKCMGAVGQEEKKRDEQQ
jgi:hypothetical protein